MYFVFWFNFYINCETCWILHFHVYKIIGTMLLKFCWFMVWCTLMKICFVVMLFSVRPLSCRNSLNFRRFWYKRNLPNFRQFLCKKYFVLKTVYLSMADLDKRIDLNINVTKSVCSMVYGVLQIIESMYIYKYAVNYCECQCIRIDLNRKIVMEALCNHFETSS